MKETWRAVPGFEYRYEASSCGRIRSISGLRPGLIQPFKQCKAKYMRVNVYWPTGKMTQRGVHQLVAAAFYGPRPDGLVVNHIDGDPTNNRLKNLEYVTPRENALHASRLGLLPGFPGEANPQAKLTVDQVMDIKSLLSSGFKDKQLSEMYSVHRGTIGQIRREKNWPTVPIGPWTPDLEREYRAGAVA